MRRVLLGLAGLGWASACFVGGLWLAFPEDAARTRVAWEVSRASKDEYALEVAHLSPWRLSGLDARDVKLYTVKKPRKARPKKGGDAEAPAEGPALERTLAFSLDRLAARMALLPLLSGDRAVAFVAETLGGTVDGTWAQSGEGTKVAFSVDALDLARVPHGEGSTALQLLGRLDANGDLLLDTQDTRKSAGSMRFDLPGFGLAKGSKLGGFDLPEVVFDKAVLAFEVEDGKARVTDGTFESATLDATVTGDITLNKRPGRSRLRLEVVFTLPPDLDQLAQLAPDLRRARDAEGKYHYQITGTVLDPSARPSRSGASKLRDRIKPTGDADGAGSAPAAGDAPAGAKEPVEPRLDADTSPEDRRAAREERLRERRERMRRRREEAEARGDVGEKLGRDPGPPRDEPDDLPYIPPGAEPYIPPGLEPSPDDGPPDVEEL
jgi:type II secretion system protein N